MKRRSADAGTLTGPGLALVTSRYVELARERERRDQEAGEGRGLFYDRAEGERVANFIGLLRHYKGEWAGAPFRLAPWQLDDIIMPLFSWKRADGTRRFRHAYIEVPRKNGKSTLAAAIGLYLTIADGEMGAEVYSTATKKDQAKIVWGDAAEMVKLSRLRSHVRVLRNNINNPRTWSKFEPLGADSDTLDGLNAHANIVDELHAHRDRRLWDVMQTSMGARRQPMTIAITTAGVARQESIGLEEHNHAVAVLEGALEDDSTFAYIAAAEPDDDWTDPRVWAKANPNLGSTVKLEYLENEADHARRSAGYLNTFLRLHLDIWTSQVTRWLSLEDWNACSVETPIESLYGQRCFGGLDLASTTDIAAFLLVFPDVDGSYDVLSRFWVPADRIVERSRRDRVPYDAWARMGLITATEGNVIDYAVIRREINELGDRHSVQEIGIDPWNATQLGQQLTEDGFSMVAVRQGFATLSAPTKEVERLVLQKKLAHRGNPVLRWMAANTAISSDAAGNMKPAKDKSTERIDGIVALIIAIERAMRHEDTDRVYPGPAIVVG